MHAWSRVSWSMNIGGSEGGAWELAPMGMALSTASCSRRVVISLAQSGVVVVEAAIAVGLSDGGFAVGGGWSAGGSVGAAPSGGGKGGWHLQASWDVVHHADVVAALTFAAAGFIAIGTGAV